MRTGHTVEYARPLPRSSPIAKRAFDIVGALLALVVFAPLLALVAIAIRIDSTGPVFYRQERYGVGRTRFCIYKFRTMRDENNDEFRQAMRDDERITRVGRILRRVNLDELPQLLNVLLGDMSLVGPRPHPVALDEQFAPRVDRYWDRYDTLPGITGWAQVKGFRGETDTLEKMKHRVAHDLEYLQRRSFWFDIRILLMTLFAASAYRNAF
ncbi:sugar transferase [Aquamicrobium zhengzhouense]|uniref:Sugar transferase n=1 Tax=Aquamicrobium zhengzhouense TaxID=2781738 RepID=A0ABS0SBA2_9HYPH|nr:sugar transferase [Aquamicrobium zhengzhouense]MBI1619772.1 sugar transferase [Aquamicrobium zhengzhouense]